MTSWSLENVIDESFLDASIIGHKYIILTIRFGWAIFGAMAYLVANCKFFNASVAMDNTIFNEDIGGVNRR